MLFAASIETSSKVRHQKLNVLSREVNFIAAHDFSELKLRSIPFLLLECRIESSWVWILLAINREIQELTIPLSVSQKKNLSIHQHLPILLRPVRCISKAVPFRDPQLPTTFPAVLNSPIR
jgi:hypothetical protein